MDPINGTLYPLFPDLPGKSWSIMKSALFDTMVVQHASGRELRAPRRAAPVWQFSLQYDGLAHDFAHHGLFFRSLQMLIGATHSAKGQALPFIYADQLDDYAQDSILGYGDGVNRTFYFQRPIGIYAETVQYVTAIDAVRVNGTPQFYNWDLVWPNILKFNSSSAPISGADITSDFNFAYICRFLSDQQDFENFIEGLCQVRSLKFRTVRS